jgi:hypothetical protein
MIQSAGNVRVPSLEMLAQDLVNQAGPRPALVFSSPIEQLSRVLTQANKEGFVVAGHGILSDCTVNSLECTKTTVPKARA